MWVRGWATVPTLLLAVLGTMICGWGLSELFHDRAWAPLGCSLNTLPTFAVAFWANDEEERHTFNDIPIEYLAFVPVGLSIVTMFWVGDTAGWSWAFLAPFGFFAVVAGVATSWSDRRAERYATQAADADRDPAARARKYLARTAGAGSREVLAAAAWRHVEQDGTTVFTGQLARLVVGPSGIRVQQPSPGRSHGRWETRLDVGWDDIADLRFAATAAGRRPALYVIRRDGTRERALYRVRLTEQQWTAADQPVRRHSGQRLSLRHQQPSARPLTTTRQSPTPSADPAASANARAQQNMRRARCESCGGIGYDTETMAVATSSSWYLGRCRQCGDRREFTFRTPEG